jgi:hypothetical protein
LNNVMKHENVLSEMISCFIFTKFAAFIKKNTCNLCVLERGVVGFLGGTMLGF